MLRLIYRFAVVWTVVGLVGGLAYREVTKLLEFTGRTQLAFVHTHALVWGTVFMFVLLALAVVLPGLTADRRMRWGLHLFNAGLVLTVGMLAFKGALQAMEVSWADHAALAGVSGLGHMTLTAALVLLLLAVGRSVRSAQARSEAGPAGRVEEPDSLVETR